MTSLTVDTELSAQGPAAAIELTDEQVGELGGGKRAAVRVTIGDRSARLRLAVMGGRTLIGLSKAARAELGVEIGQRVTATIALDETPREVEVPEALAAALAADPAAAQAFAGLAFTHRKEYAVWVADAKREETRDRRVAQAVEMLREGRTRS
ncbi:MAG: YdeI/OmpD-associated family protein [Nocardioidaceae bacterium]